jgi:hypothetical protein
MTGHSGLVASHGKEPRKGGLKFQACKKKPQTAKYTVQTIIPKYGKDTPLEASAPGFVDRSYLASRFLHVVGW